MCIRDTGDFCVDERHYFLLLTFLKTFAILVLSSWKIFCSIKPACGRQACLPIGRFSFYGLIKARLIRGALDWKTTRLRAETPLWRAGTLAC
jgi:hypothetical protein